MKIKTPKLRIHREWFRTVSLGGRVSCPNCKSKVYPPQHIWSWGEYLYGKWRTVRHFCKECFPVIKADLLQHKLSCGCQFELVAYSGNHLPLWLNLETKPVAEGAA